MVYAKAGVAIAPDRDTFVCTTGPKPTIPSVTLIGCPSRTDSNTNTGWIVGWGSEFGLTPNVSVAGEVSSFNLGSEHVNLAGTPAEIQRDGFISTVGLRFRFGG